MHWPMVYNLQDMTVTFFGNNMKKNRKPRLSFSVPCPRQTVRLLNGELNTKLMPFSGLRNWKKPSMCNDVLKRVLGNTKQIVVREELENSLH